MTEPINLNRARKARAKAADKARAAENRTRFGRSKAEREAAQRIDALTERRLEGHRRDGEAD